MYVNIVSPSVLLLYNVCTVLVFNWRRQNGQNVLIKDWSVGSLKGSPFLCQSTHISLRRSQSTDQYQIYAYNIMWLDCDQ